MNSIMKWITNGYLEIIYGPMFSGKSTELIRRIRISRAINKKVLVVKPIIDDRYMTDRIVSHNFDSEECKVVKKLCELDNEINNYDFIIIDEGQFFPDLKEVVIKWVEDYKLYVVVSGLDGDYKRNPIGSILELAPYADKFYKQTSYCKICCDGTEAIFSFKINIDNQEQIDIGSEDKYKPVCRKHYIELSKEQ